MKHDEWDFNQHSFQMWSLIQGSDTYARLTEDEKIRCITALNLAERNGAIKGTLETRKAIYLAVYEAFLYGVGYTGWGWRRTDDAPKF